MQPLKRPWRLYLDTSVFGGCFDAAEGWDVDSRRVIAYFLEGREILITSDVVERELKDAPPKIREIYRGIPDEYKSRISLSEAAQTLAAAYIEAGVVGPKWKEDCEHVALATLSGADAIVSWNFKHLVRMDRIRAFNLVNVAQGRATMQIISPKEVNLDDD